MKVMKKLIMILSLALPLTAVAESGLPWMKDLAGDRELPLPWGVGVDFFTMDQDYQIDKLDLSFPGLGNLDPSLLEVRNETQEFDIKLDAWLFPFLNAFVILGTTSGETSINISGLGLPLPFDNLAIDTDGDVFGGGVTLAVGGDQWFTSLTATLTDTDLSGDFDSSVEAFTLQPRVGLVRDQWNYWVGGFFLDVEEKHKGSIGIPFLGTVPFDVELSQEDDWNFTVGVRHQFSRKFDASLELGFGGRDITLFNVNYRF